MLQDAASAVREGHIIRRHDKHGIPTVLAGVALTHLTGAALPCDNCSRVPEVESRTLGGVLTQEVIDAASTASHHPDGGHVHTRM